MNRYIWTSPVSTVENGEIIVRGYSIQEVMKHLSFHDSIFLVLRGELPSKEQSEVFRACLSSILDYAMGPAPFAGRVVASGNPQLGPAMAAGILAQGQYAVSPQDAGEFLNNALIVLEEVKQDIPRAALAVVTDYRSKKMRIPGLGHPTNLGVDPRAYTIGEILKENGLWGASARLLEDIQKVWNRETGKNLVINVDGMLAVALTELGFEPCEMGGVAAMSMLPGIIANAVHELKNGVPIRQISELTYTGPAKRYLADFIGQRG